MMLITKLIVKKEIYYNLLIVIIFAVIAYLMTYGYYLYKGYLPLIDDGSFHFQRLYLLWQAVKEGQYLNYIYYNSLDGFGYPLGIFYPDLFLYPFALLSKIGISAYQSFKLLMFSIVFFSLISMFIVSNRIFAMDSPKQDSRFFGFFAAVFYIFSPYYLIDLYFRISIGELLAFIFIPFVFLGIYRIIRAENAFVCVSLGISSIIYSHILTAMIVFIGILLVSLLNIRKIINCKFIVQQYLYAAGLTCLLSAKQIVPIIEAMQNGEYWFQIPFFEINKLSEHTLITFGIVGKMEIIVTSLLFLMMIMLSAKEISFKSQSFLLFFATIIISSDLFMWDYLEQCFDYIKVIQFPFRFLVLTTFFFPITIGLYFIKLRKTLRYAVLLSVIIILIYPWYHQIINIDGPDYYYFEKYINKGEIIGFGIEYLPITFDSRPFSLKEGLNLDRVNAHLDHLNNTYPYKFIRKDSVTSITVNDTVTYNIVAPLIYYYGYRAEVNGIEYETVMGEGGLLYIINNSKLIGNIEIWYQGTKLQSMSLYISLITILIIIIIYTYKWALFDRCCSKSEQNV